MINLACHHGGRLLSGRLIGALFGKIRIVVRLGRKHLRVAQKLTEELFGGAGGLYKRDFDRLVSRLGSEGAFLRGDKRLPGCLGKLPRRHFREMLGVREQVAGLNGDLVAVCRQIADDGLALNVVACREQLLNQLFDFLLGLNARRETSRRLRMDGSRQEAESERSENRQGDGQNEPLGRVFLHVNHLVFLVRCV